MIRLTWVELRRLLARRLTRFSVLGGLLAVGLILFAVYTESQPPSEAERRQAQAAYDQAVRDWEVNGEQMMADCRRAQAQEQQVNPEADFGCDEMAPRPEGWLGEESTFAALWPGLMTGAAFLAMLICFIIGAGFVAAEFSTGAISTWLTYEPRRGRVFASKLLAPAIAMPVVTALILALVLSGGYLIVRRHGDVQMLSADWGQLLATGGRGVVLGGLAGVLGAAGGALMRHTAAVLGLVMGYLIIVENILGAIVERFQPWLARLNVQAWLEHGAVYYTQQCVTGPTGELSCSSVDQTLSFARASIYLGVASVVVVVLSLVLFRRRDVI